MLTIIGGMCSFGRVAGAVVKCGSSMYHALGAANIIKAIVLCNRVEH